MQTIYRIFSFFLVFTLASNLSVAQELKDVKVTHRIIKQNGTSFVGKIVSRDAREILIDTESIGLVFVPKHEIKEIIEIYEGEKDVTGGLFSTRYFLTTNGFHINKGDNYIQWNLFGPDFQFGVAENFTVGIMTSWVGMPIIGTTKYSTQLSDKVHAGVGFLGGTGSWAFPKYGLLLPYGFLTLGNPVNNINITAGYGLLFSEGRNNYIITNEVTSWSTNYFEESDKAQSEGRVLLSVAGMFRINNKFSFVFDSFFMLAGKDKEFNSLRETYDEISHKTTYYTEIETRKSKPLVVLAPGLRFQVSESSSFQFGFTGIHTDGEFIQVPIPMVQWFKRI